MIASHAEESSVIFVHKKDEGSYGSGIEVSKLANGEGHGRSGQLGFGLGTTSRNWKCMFQQSFGSICGAAARIMVVEVVKPQTTRQ